MIDAGLIAAAGVALWGKAWRPGLGDALGVNERTIRHWLAGTMPVPDGVWRDLAELAQQRRDALELVSTALAERLKT